MFPPFHSITVYKNSAADASNLSTTPIKPLSALENVPFVNIYAVVQTKTTAQINRIVKSKWIHHLKSFIRPSFSPSRISFSQLSHLYARCPSWEKKKKTKGKKKTSDGEPKDRQRDIEKVRKEYPSGLPVNTNVDFINKSLNISNK